MKDCKLKRVLLKTYYRFLNCEKILKNGFLELINIEELCHTKLNGQYGMFYIENKNVIAKAQEDKFYREMYEKYRKMIEDGVSEAEIGPQQKNDTIWVCWLQGEKDAPPLVKACINSLRKNMPEKRIVVLTESSIQEYVQFPAYIWEKRKSGLISHAHFSDLLRVAILCEYGGIWCDATLLCTSTPPKYMTDSPMFVFKSMDLQRIDIQTTLCSNWYIAAWSNQRILLLTRNLLYEHWRSSDSIGNYFAFHIFLAMSARRYPDDWKRIPFYNNHSPHTLQFELGEKYSQERWDQITTMSPLHKLNHHDDYTNTGYSYYWWVVSQYDHMYDAIRGKIDEGLQV